MPFEPFFLEDLIEKNGIKWESFFTNNILYHFSILNNKIGKPTEQFQFLGVWIARNIAKCHISQRKCYKKWNTSWNSFLKYVSVAIY